jgi:hypothetical protein
MRWLALLLVVLAWPVAAQADARDYDPMNPEWNGTSELTNLAGGLGVPVQSTDHLDWSELDPERDILVFLYPRDVVDGNAMLAWIEAGGRVLLADDFGRCDQAFSVLGFDRLPARGVRATRFHEDNVALPVATPWQTDHPLARGVQELVTNHPAMLRADRGQGGVFGFGDRQALVVAGERGRGRFVALADPSVLINGMLAFGGNVSFAANLIQWLTPAGGARRALLVTSDFVVTGTPPAPAHSELGLPGAARAMVALDHELREASLWTPDRPVLRALGVALAALLVLVTMWRLPLLRRVGVNLDWLKSLGGSTGRDLAAVIKKHDEPAGGADFAEPSALLREHIEGRLQRLTGLVLPLNLPPAALARVVEDAGGQVAASAVAALEAAGLRMLPTRGDAHLPARHVSRREFERVYDAARRLDAALSSKDLS